MLCFMCKQTKKIEFIHSFIYDLIALKNTLMPVNFHHLIILIARIWPDSLVWPHSPMSNMNMNYYHSCEEITKKGDLKMSAFNPLLCSIIYIVKNHITNIDRLSTYYSKSNETVCSNYYLYVSFEQTIAFKKLINSIICLHKVVRNTLQLDFGFKMPTRCVQSIS